MALVVTYVSTSQHVNIELLVLQYQRRGKNLSRTILTISQKWEKRQIISPPKIYTPHNIIESLVRILNILNIISKIKSILFIHGVCICIFAYLLKLICSLQITICGNFVVMVKVHMCRVGKNMTSPLHLWKVDVEWSITLPSCFSVYTVNKCPFTVYVVLHFSSFLCFSRVISLYKMASKHSLVLVRARRLWGCALQRKYVL